LRDDKVRWVRSGKENWVQPFEQFLLEGFFALEEGTIKGLVIAGTSSGCGKTTVALGLMSALVRRGLRTAPFKVGPDFIDPGHHTRVTGAASRNLDGWMLSRDTNLACFKKRAGSFDVAVVEGVMGLFDGYDGRSEDGSTAQMAKWLNLPVLFVVDAKSMARSAAALVQGFERFDEDLRFIGVLFNRIGGSRHLDFLKQALEGAVRMPCLGGFPREEGIEIPERHLGLFTSQDHPLTDGAVNLLAEKIEANIDIESLLSRMPEVAPDETAPTPPITVDSDSVRMGIARDRAFCFYYPENLELLEASGAKLVFFSPLEEDRLPEGLGGLYFGGGYPELFAERLSKQKRLRGEILEKVRSGMPVYGECGGFMYLCNSLIDTGGIRYEMAGCFPFVTRMFPRLKSLGYRQVTLSRDTVIGKSGQVIRGHEFHYSELAAGTHEIETAYRINGRSGGAGVHEGFQVNRCLGSYIHLHFGSCPETARHFLQSCRAYGRERKNHREAG